jgi:hypothetical protein
MNDRKKIALFLFFILVVGAIVMYNSYKAYRREGAVAIQDLTKYEKDKTPIVPVVPVETPEVFEQNAPVRSMSTPHTGMRTNRYTLDDVYPCREGASAAVQCGQIQQGACSESPSLVVSATVSDDVACQNACWLSDPKKHMFFSFDRTLKQCSCFETCSRVSCSTSSTIGGICGYRM